jgi:5'-nucleotidase / UDP-sugar diphosphatase
VFKAMTPSALVLCASVAVFAGGCQQHAAPAPSASNDLTVTPVAQAPAPTYAPPSSTAQPVTYDAASSATPMPAGGNGGAVGSPVSGQSYVVKRGDTLYGIARRAYGDGKQWQRIAAANPGLSPQSLRVGQTIVLP